MIRAKVVIAEDLIKTLLANGCEINEPELRKAVFRFLHDCDKRKFSLKCEPVSNTVWGEYIENTNNLYAYYDGNDVLIEKVYASREELTKHLEELIDAAKMHSMLVPLSAMYPGFIFCDVKGVFHTIRELKKPIPTQSLLRLASKPLEERNKQWTK